MTLLENLADIFSLSINVSKFKTGHIHFDVLLDTSIDINVSNFTDIEII